MENENVPLLEVPVDTMQTLLNYLATRPYNEVFPLIELIKNTVKEPSEQAAEESK